MSAVAAVATAAPPLAPVEGWRAHFGGQDAVYHFRLPESPVHDAPITWSLGYQGRVLARGEKAIPRAPERADPIEVRFTLPHVKEGVSLPLDLVVRRQATGEGSPASSWEGRLHVFAEDPFSGRRERLRELKIGLYDPVGLTREGLELLEIPFSARRSLDGDLGNERLLVIGSGIDFDRHRGLWEALIGVASSGGAVLVLAPAAGSILLSEGGGNSPVGDAALSFGHEEACRRLNAAVDCAGWPPDGRTVFSRVVLARHGESVVGTFGNQPEGWPWLEIAFPQSGGTLLFCGLGIAEKIRVGPSPRFLLASLIEHLAADRPKQAAAPESAPGANPASP